MNFTDQLLGFDARDVSEAHGARWPTQQKCEWLLRSGVTFPLSVDDMIWPSVLRREDYESYFGVSWKGFIQNLWEDLPRLLQCICNVKTDIAPYWIVAVALATSILNDHERNLWNSIILPTVPSSIEKTWAFLGFDVADRFLLSGLTNCILRRHVDFAQLQSRFLHKLNKFHLFEDLEVAREFKDISDSRVVEHAPFFVFSIWQVG